MRTFGGRFLTTLLACALIVETAYIVAIWLGYYDFSPNVTANVEEQTVSSSTPVNEPAGAEIDSSVSKDLPKSDFNENPKYSQKEPSLTEIKPYNLSERLNRIDQLKYKSSHQILTVDADVDTLANTDDLRAISSIILLYGLKCDAISGIKGLRYFNMAPSEAIYNALQDPNRNLDRLESYGVVFGALEKEEIRLSMLGGNNNSARAVVVRKLVSVIRPGLSAKNLILDRPLIVECSDNFVSYNFVTSNLTAGLPIILPDRSR